MLHQTASKRGIASASYYSDLCAKQTSAVLTNIRETLRISKILMLISYQCRTMFISAFLSSSGRCQNVDAPSNFFMCLTISRITCRQKGFRSFTTQQITDLHKVHGPS